MRNILIFFAFFIAANAYSGEHSEWPSGSAMDVGAGVNKELASYQKSMNATINRIGLLLKSDCNWCTNDGDDYYDLLKNIKANQAAWATYANAECELLYKLEGPAWNTWTSTRAVRCNAGQAYNRLRQLKRAERCLQRKNKGEEFYSFQNCLYQLSPLSLQQ